VAELLSLCAGQPEEDAGVATHEGQNPSAALYPTKYTGLGFDRAVAAYMARQLADEARFRWLSWGARKAPIYKSGRCRFLPIHFSSTLTKALIEASHRQRITLNAILSAGMMAAVQRNLYPSPRAPLRHIIFTDVRPHLRGEIPASELGCHMAMLRLTILVERDGNLWSLARDIQNETLRVARAGERYLSNSVSPSMMKMILGLRAFRMSATALSYSGPVDLPASHGPFAVTAVHAFTANFSMGPEYSALVHLFRDELWCDILYLDCDMDSTKAQQIARDMEAALEAAC
jgi:hypothetical protein